ncbi:MAG: amidohydrolase family protein [Proteobacteria bacterium]|nr:amidohydrolase family protein [Pseudomonadota bacterium]
MTALAFDVPPGACDCHTHVFGEPMRFPFAKKRTYTPPQASVAELVTLQRGLRLDRVVIVQPSVYGTDNSCTLDGMRRLGARARGVAVIDPATSEAELDVMARTGMRGVRLNLATAGETDPDAARSRLAALATRLKPRGWHVQIYTQLSVIAALQNQIAAAPVPVVIDHFGGARGELGPDQPGFAALLALVRGGNVYVKLSGSYRSSERAPDYPDMAALARALIEAGPDRMVWGSDWPHPDSPHGPDGNPHAITPFHVIDDGALLNQLAAWAPDPAQRRKILVDNPARLYGF